MSFESVMDTILKDEGLYVNDPNDRGGETNFGISKRSYPNEDIANLTRERALEIYRRDYWDKLNIGALPEAAQLPAQGGAINQGAGFMGSVLRKTQDPAEIVDMRTARYNSIIKNDPTQEKFRNGWSNRADMHYLIGRNPGTLPEGYPGNPSDMLRGTTSPLEYQDGSPQQAEPLQAAYERGREQEADSKNDWEKFQQYADNASLQELMARQQQLGAFGKNWGAGQ